MRRFTKSLVAGMALGALLGLGYYFLHRQQAPEVAVPKIAQSAKPKHGQDKKVTSNKSLDSLLNDIVENGETIELDDKVISSVSRVLLADPSKVTSTLAQEWIRRYSQTPLRGSLTWAMKRSLAVIGPVRKIFADTGAPPEYAFLAIPESHWLLKPSPAGAAGIFQFMPKTAKKRGAIIVKGYDSRLHSLEAATMAAQELKYLHKSFNNDWLLALAAYNSGMPWRYLKVRERFGDGTVSYFNYLTYLGHELRKIDEAAKKQSFKAASIRLKRGSSIDGVLYSLKLPTTKENREELRKANKGKQRYAPNESVKISQGLQYQRLVKTGRSKFIDENLKYPPKFLAVASILKDEFPSYFNTPPQPHQYTVFTVPQQPYHNHIVQRKQTLTAIAKQYGVSEYILREYNKLKRKDLRINQLKVPYTLPILAKQHEITLGQASADNPHILPSNKGYLPLPPGAKVYLKK